MPQSLPICDNCNDRPAIVCISVAAKDTGELKDFWLCATCQPDAMLADEERMLRGERPDSAVPAMTKEELIRLLGEA